MDFELIFPSDTLRDSILFDFNFRSFGMIIICGE